MYILLFKNLITKLLIVLTHLLASGPVSASMGAFLSHQVLQIVLWNGSHVSHLLLQPASHTQVSASKERRPKASDFMDPVDCE